MFEQGLDENEIIYKRIGIATPRHNGKVERQPRIDARRFYKKMRTYNLEDSRWQPAKYNQKSNGAVNPSGLQASGRSSGRLSMRNVLMN